MSRIGDAFLGDNNDELSGALDPTYGGMHGYAPNLAGVGPDGEIYEAWRSNQAYVPRNVVAIMISGPAGLKYFPNAEKLIEVYKSFFETNSEVIEGLTSGLTVEFGEQNIGGGNNVQEEAVDVKRERTIPVHTVTEKKGRPYQKLLDLIIRYLIMDPETKTALVGTLDDFNSDDGYAGDMAACTILYYEPDITHTKAEKAWLVTNMKPKGNGDVLGKKDKSGASEILQLNIEFTGITETGTEVLALAQKFIDTARARMIDPQKAPAFVSDISPDVADDKAPYGYNKSTSVN